VVSKVSAIVLRALVRKDGNEHGVDAGQTCEPLGLSGWCRSLEGRPDVLVDRRG
jgi:hypothetical protein